MSFQGEQHPGVETPPTETQGFRFNHTMLRVKDPERSLAFYSRVFGMRVLRKLDFPEMQFTLYFLANLGDDDAVPDDPAERNAYTFAQKGLLELTHNWGTEDQEGFAYHDGNAEPQGFGHICFSVPDLHAAVAWFDANHVEFKKRPDDGKMKDVAFVKDPDGYWIEVVQPELSKGLGQ
ncbi:lactoylglutathione lyase [Chromohalobacter sarecensis]|uniref:Lactoylglutathione lyase n=1 Tax=Chromohalobacter sarecensis TaxID=245294 RepID=A0ABV9D1W5_9GAMM|nr:lactoylglutathione lyase [Chromohalobacter sarecensis]MCK0715232.1 lactoylglutathione lyase [Chromohalobacter sarecensis]